MRAWLVHLAARGAWLLMALVLALAVFTLLANLGSVAELLFAVALGVPAVAWADSKFRARRR